jgi:SAM-dependent methyltransferase
VGAVTPVDDLAAHGVPTPEAAAAHAEALTHVLPRALTSVFDAVFIRSSLLYDTFVDRLALQVLRATGIDVAAREPGTAAEITARAGLRTERALIPVDWMLRRLADRGLLAAGGGAGANGRFHVGDLPELDPGVPRTEQLRWDPAWRPAYTLAETAAADYPALLRGERTGEEILFSPTRLRLWVEFFSNENNFYLVNNAVGAVAIETWAPAGPLRILELGGGLGSAAVALLTRLKGAGRWDDLRDYRFTELVPAFLRRGQQAVQRTFPDATWMTFGALDMNRPFAEQSIARDAASLVYAVNTIHVARDLDVTLGEIFHALAPGGHLVMSECVHPAPGDALAVEFIFNLMETFRAPVLHPAHRPNGGFLTPAQWRGALGAAGFVDVRLLPDIERMAERFPAFCVAAIGARRPGSP